MLWCACWYVLSIANCIVKLLEAINLATCNELSQDFCVYVALKEMNVETTSCRLTSCIT